MLEAVLAQARTDKTPEGWAEAQRAAHQVYVKAEQGDFSEVANAVLHVEDAVAAVAEGELAPDSGTFRQVDAALRAARAACSMPEAQAAPIARPRDSRHGVARVRRRRAGRRPRATRRQEAPGSAVLLARKSCCRASGAPSALIVELGSADLESFA